jgi:hypothetical protein
MSRWAVRAAASAGVIVLAALAVTPRVDAQYFGRNKVQYREFAFELLQTEHFDIYFYPEERSAARDVGRMAERWNSRLSQMLRHSLRGRQPIVLYASAPDFQQTNVVQGEVGEAPAESPKDSSGASCCR